MKDVVTWIKDRLAKDGKVGSRILVVGPSQAALESWKQETATELGTAQGVEFITAEDLVTRMSMALAVLGKDVKFPPNSPWKDVLGTLLQSLASLEDPGELEKGWTAHPEYWVGLMGFLEDLDQAQASDPEVLLGVLEKALPNRGQALAKVARAFWKTRDARPTPNFLDHQDLLADFLNSHGISHVLWAGFYDVDARQAALLKTFRDQKNINLAVQPPGAMERNLLHSFRPFLLPLLDPENYSHQQPLNPGAALARACYGTQNRNPKRSPLASWPSSMSILYGDTPMNLLRKTSAEAHRLHEQEGVSFSDMAIVVNRTDPWRGPLYSLLIEEQQRPENERVTFHFPATLPLALNGPGQVFQLLQQALQGDLNPAILRELVLHPAVSLLSEKGQEKENRKLRAQLAGDFDRWAQAPSTAGGLHVAGEDPWAFELATSIEESAQYRQKFIPAKNSRRRLFITSLWSLFQELKHGDLSRGLRSLAHFLNLWSRVLPHQTDTASLAAVAQWQEFLGELESMAFNMPTQADSSLRRVLYVASQLLGQHGVLLADHQGGIHILDAQFARGRHFRVIFLLGLVDGDWPGQVGQDHVLGEEERERLAPALEHQGMGHCLSLLPKRRHLEEKLMFRAVLEGASERVVFGINGLSHEGGPINVSAHLEEVLVAACGEEDKAFLDALLAGQVFPAVFQNPAMPGVTLPNWLRVLVPPMRNPILLEGSSPKAEAFAALSPLRGARFSQVNPDPLEPYRLAEAMPLESMDLSATSLKNFLTCPWQGILKRHYQIEEIKSRQAFFEFDSLEKGNLYHLILEKFYQPLVQVPDLSDLEAYELKKRMQKAIAEVMGPAEGASPLFLTARAGLVEDALSLAQQETLRFKGHEDLPHLKRILGAEITCPPAKKEKGPVLRQRVNFQNNDRTVQLNLTGKFDRIEQDQTGIHIVDVKTGALRTGTEASKLKNQRDYFNIQHLLYPPLYKAVHGDMTLVHFSYHFATAKGGFEWLKGESGPGPEGQFVDMLGALDDLLKAKMAPALPAKPPSGGDFDFTCGHCSVQAMCHAANRPPEEVSFEILDHELIEKFWDTRNAFLGGFKEPKGAPKKAATKSGPGGEF